MASWLVLPCLLCHHTLLLLLHAFALLLPKLLWLLACGCKVVPPCCSPCQLCLAQFSCWWLLCLQLLVPKETWLPWVEAAWQNTMTWLCICKYEIWHQTYNPSQHPPSYLVTNYQNQKPIPCDWCQTLHHLAAIQPKHFYK